MAKEVESIGGIGNPTTQHWICDAIADLNAIDVAKLSFGCTAIVIETGNVYMLNSQKVWVEL